LTYQPNKNDAKKLMLVNNRNEILILICSNFGLKLKIYLFL